MFKSLALLSLCASSALGFVAPGTKTAHQSTSAGFVSSSGAVSRSTSQLEAHKLVLIRHGESEWNDLNIFTGWADAALNEKGLREAAQGGQLLKDAGFTFDLCYTSVLKRAIKTLWIVLEEMDLMYLPIKNDWRLNERPYGGLQGLNKQETVDKHGKDQVLVW